MKLTVEPCGGFLLAKSSGTIDDSADELFQELLHPIVGQDGARVVFDLSDSDRINSHGVAHLVKLIAHANTNSSRVMLAGPSSFVAGVFNATRLDTYFEIVESVSQAEQLLAKEQHGRLPPPAERPK